MTKTNRVRFVAIAMCVAQMACGATGLRCNVGYRGSCQSQEAASGDDRCMQRYESNPNDNSCHVLSADEGSYEMTLTLYTNVAECFTDNCIPCPTSGSPCPGVAASGAASSVAGTSAAAVATTTKTAAPTPRGPGSSSSSSSSADDTGAYRFGSRGVSALVVSVVAALIVGL